MDRAALAEEDAATEARRATALGHLRTEERDSLLLDTECSCGSDLGVESGVLRGGGGDLEHPRAAEPDVDAELLHGRDRALGCARDGEGTLVAEPRAKPREVRPVTVEEASVATARPVAAPRCLEEHDAKRRLPAPQRQPRPESGVAASDDRDVGLDLAFERRLGRIGRRLLPPPRRLTAGD